MQGALSEYQALQGGLLLELSHEVKARQHLRELVSAKAAARSHLLREIEAKQHDLRNANKALLLLQDESGSLLDELNLDRVSKKKKKDSLERNLGQKQAENARLKAEKDQLDKRTRDRRQVFQNSKQESQLQAKKAQSRRGKYQNIKAHLASVKEEQANLQSDLQKAQVAENELQTAIRRQQESIKQLRQKLALAKEQSASRKEQQKGNGQKLSQLRSKQIQLFRAGRHLDQYLLQTKAKYVSARNANQLLLEESVSLQEVVDLLGNKLVEEQLAARQIDRRICETTQRVRELEEFGRKERERGNLLRNQLQKLKTQAAENELQWRRLLRRGLG